MTLTPELSELQLKARAFAAENIAPGARQADATGRPQVSMTQLGAAGLLDDRLSAQALAVVYEELGRVDSSVRGAATVQVSLVAKTIANTGSNGQQRRWLGGLRTGEVIGCYALTEPDAGSDVRSIKTMANRVQSGGWHLTGQKHWITNGSAADLALVFAMTGEGLTCFLVPTTLEGFSATHMSGLPLGHRASDHALIQLSSVEVGEDMILGSPGGGIQIANAALLNGRLGVAAGAVGIMQACQDACIDFARSRRQFGRRIGDFEMIQSSLADMAADLAAGRLLVQQAAAFIDANEDAAQAVSLAKLFCTEAALRSADAAILMHGARGYSNEFPVERYWRDAKGMQIYEGTSHIQRIIIARDLIGKE
jgi:alkylation response protein AidB-like acyl-CoA dehydrogenase